MKCYKCAKGGVETEAVAVCAVCGMGLCMQHARMVEITLHEAAVMEFAGTAGLGFKGKVERKVPKILCDDCYTSAATIEAEKANA